jgi:hypothetical protein
MMASSVVCASFTSSKSGAFSPPQTTGSHSLGGITSGQTTKPSNSLSGMASLSSGRQLEQQPIQCIELSFRVGHGDTFGLISVTQ